MYKITTAGRLYLIGNIRDVLDFLASISIPGITLKQYLDEQMHL
jgi:hypothetical protein